MMRAANPNRTVVAQFCSAQGKPLAVELIDVFRSAAFVPIALIHAYLLTAMNADAAVTEEVWWVGKMGPSFYLFIMTSCCKL